MKILGTQSTTVGTINYTHQLQGSFILSVSQVANWLNLKNYKESSLDLRGQLVRNPDWMGTVRV